MSGLVIKSWSADTKPVDGDNNYVSITGRRGGLWGWILSILGIDPTTRIRVGIERIEFFSSSLDGTQTVLIPLQSVSSTYYGYHKPWKSAVAIFVAVVWFAASLGFGPVGERVGSTTSGFAVFAVAGAIAAIISLVYYFLNRTLTLGFVADSGVGHGIRFKRSVIENKDIDERQAQTVCMIVQRLIESRARS
jgi:hypothetical protein